MLNLPAISSDVSAQSFTRQSVNIREPLNQAESKPQQESSFQQQVNRQLLLNRLGVDAEKLEELEKRIDELENKGQLSDKEREQLDNLYAAKEQLFEEAARRRNGDELPPGSLIETSA
ncbi:hypothetical protein [Idiomarina xiamenensis]|uniref:Uncharacterized protein n=1 Tax=Idiomarina xiamenensis 10-D-4 TaxID=740709 RepID=K2KSL4_9GAMM|nr:hypothetical protein [Idiomarina xiamenensis]EKE85419.1 hypothetical protein A10D4_03705 [Idiomarina xiamenensis 10-D-4]